MRGIKLGIWILIIFLIPALLIKEGWNSQLAPLSSDKTDKVIVVARGDAFKQVADKLKNENLIRSSWAFKLRAKQSGLESKLKAGTFKVSPSMSAQEILKVLTSSPLDTWVTLIEGWRVEEMAKKLNDELEINQKEFLKVAKEGYMFPDTYLFPKDYSAEQIATRLRNTFDQKYTDDLKGKIKALGLTESQGVILASIVEREARSAGVRQMVASILLKRLKIGMGLNADATIQYALGYQKQEKTWWKKNLTHDDLTVNSPYNTYINSGLPPTPIANPSLSSLQAVGDADSSTPYLYYYHDSKGNSYYAKTLEEHNANVVNYP